MNLTRNQLKELIRQSIREIREGGKGSGRKPDDHTGGPSYANVPKGAKTSKQAKAMKKKGRPTKPGSAKDIENRAMSAADAANAKMDAAEKAAKKKKVKEGASPKTMKKIKDTMKYDALGDLEDVIDGLDIDKKYYRDIDRYLNAIRDVEQGMKPSGYDKPAKNNLLKVLKKAINESKVRRHTVKEVKMWMKTLEENRYKKTYNSDARRVAWMVNNEGVSLDEMPMSMKKKWSKAAYGREKYLAKEYLKSQKQKMSEIVLRNQIRNKILKLIK